MFFGWPIIQEFDRHFSEIFQTHLDSILAFSYKEGLPYAVRYRQTDGPY